MDLNNKINFTFNKKNFQITSTKIKEKMKMNFKEKLQILTNEINNCNTFNEKLKKWADFTVKYCHNIALITDRSFYAFQSEPKENPEVLILGLNPGGNFSYQSMYDHKTDGWGLNKSRKMITEVFIHQNPGYKGGRLEDPIKEWNILNNMNKTINVNNEFRQLFDNMVYMNILYFNSTDFNEFKDHFKELWQEVYENCIQLSTLLITEIIKPKRIICLGIDNCYKRFIGNAQSEELIKGSLYKSLKNDFKIYGMTHPSARTSNFSRENIGWHLYADWFNKPIEISITKKVSSIFSILSELALKYNLILEYNDMLLSKRFGSFKFYPQNEKLVYFLFEFQKSFYSDLMFGLYKNKSFINKAEKCRPPFDNWMNLDENFSHEDLKNYFEKEIGILLQNYDRV